MPKHLILALLPALATSALAADVLRITAPNGTIASYTLVMNATLKASQVRVRPALGVQATPAELRVIQNDYERFLNEQLPRDLNLDKLPSLSLKGAVQVQSNGGSSTNLRVSFTLPNQADVSFLQKYAPDGTFEITDIQNSGGQIPNIAGYPLFQAFAGLPSVYYQEFERGDMYRLNQELTGPELAAINPLGDSLMRPEARATTYISWSDPNRADRGASHLWAAV